MHIRQTLPLLLPLLLAGCAGSTSLTGAVLEQAGLKKPVPIPEAQLPPRTISLRLDAAKRLNVDGRGQALALLVRVYKLRQRTAFEQAPYAAFLTPEAERAALGADLLEVKELTLVPGQRLELNEKLAREASWIGVVALFHTPARQGWRMAFAAADAEKSPVTVGLHACAMTAGAALALSTVRCQ